MAKVHNYPEKLLSLEKKVMIYGYIRVSSDKQSKTNVLRLITSVKGEVDNQRKIEETYNINEKSQLSS